MLLPPCKQGEGKKVKHNKRRQHPSTLQYVCRRPAATNPASRPPQITDNDQNISGLPRDDGLGRLALQGGGLPPAQLSTSVAVSSSYSSAVVVRE